LIPSGIQRADATGQVRAVRISRFYVTWILRYSIVDRVDSFDEFLLGLVDKVRTTVKKKKSTL
jgi:hypothetical protein